MSWREREWERDSLIKKGVRQRGHVSIPFFEFFLFSCSRTFIFGRCGQGGNGARTIKQSTNDKGIKNLLEQGKGKRSAKVEERMEKTDGHIHPHPPVVILSRGRATGLWRVPNLSPLLFHHIIIRVSCQFTEFLGVFIQDYNLLSKMAAPSVVLSEGGSTFASQLLKKLQSGKTPLPGTGKSSTAAESYTHRPGRWMKRGGFRKKRREEREWERLFVVHVLVHCFLIFLLLRGLGSVRWRQKRRSLQMLASVFLIKLRRRSARWRKTSKHPTRKTTRI